MANQYELVHDLLAPQGAPPLLQNLEFYNPRLLVITLDGIVNFLIENWLLIAAALVSGGMLLWPLVARGAQGGGVSPSEAVRMMNREKAVVIDVCEPSEFEAGHIVGARSIPLANLAGAKSLPGNKTLPVVLVCASGVRSRRAAAQLQQAGYGGAISISGGMQAWRTAGLPVETGKA